MTDATTSLRRQVATWVSILAIAALCVVLEAVAFHAYAFTHRELPEDRTDDLWVERYPGLRIEMDVFRPRKGDETAPVICDRYVGWPVPGLRTTVEYPIDAPRSPSDFIHEWNHHVAWPTRIAVLPGIGVVYAKWVLFLAAMWWAVGQLRRLHMRSVERTGHCGRCGYDLGGIVAEQCPECGRAISRPRLAEKVANATSEPSAP